VRMYVCAYVCQLKDKENNILQWWQAYYRL